MTDTLYCTIDTSGLNEEDRNKAQLGVIKEAIEKEMRIGLEQDKWRCTAVTRDPRNSARIRVTCRDEAELQRVKEATQKAAAPGLRILRDQVYPVKVDNAHRATVLDQDGAVRPEAAEVFGKENDVRIAKVALLSKKDTMQAYGSMVVYVTKGSDAVQLLQCHYFHIAGDSAYTSVYELRTGSVQCYNCQATTRSPVRKFRCVPDAPKKVTITGTVRKKCPSVYRVVVRTSRLAGIAERSIPCDMSSTL